MIKKINEKIINEILYKELNLFEKKIKKETKTWVNLLNNINNFFFEIKGKRIRPIFIFLIAKIFGKISKKTYYLALIVEFIHSGTLIHDDIIDNSYIRRSFFSIYALWSSKTAILIGDFLLSKSINLAIKYDNKNLIKNISNVIKKMSLIEIYQIEKSRYLNFNEEFYYKIIKYKTAKLISICFEWGAHSAKANEKNIYIMKKIGLIIGNIFQIKDDLLDYDYDTTTIDKPRGLDILNDQITLPLIYIFNNSSIKIKKEIINMIQKKTKKNRIKLINYVIKYGGIKYAEKIIINLFKKVKNILKKYDKIEKEALLFILKKIINKNKKII